MDIRVLLVCPDQDVATLLKGVLAEMGMEAEHTPSLAHGLELLEEQKFDAIVFDFRSDPASEEFLALLRQSKKNNATMLMALVPEEFNARPLFGLGANFVLYRPLSLERIRMSLSAARSLMRRERRSEQRAHVHSKANVSYPGADDLDATLVNISDGGTLITTSQRELGKGKVYFEFALPGQKQIVRLSGQVAWQDFSGRAGVRFLDVPQASRRTIQAWLQKNGVRPGEKPAPPPEPVIERFALEPKLPAGLSQSDILSASNRRKDERVPCKLGATISPAGTNTPNHCSLSDLSEGGCYIEMPSPLPGKADVEIMVRTSDMKFKVSGEVLTSHPGFGMGVRFVFHDSREREEILRLLAVLSAARMRDEQPC
ncbi:MAG TPA: PilZ domain-containing protein [Terriglobales bacterium]|nr:PilZ domain-containing protein [Terriglobales bacterium]